MPAGRGPGEEGGWTEKVVGSNGEGRKIWVGLGWVFGLGFWVGFFFFFGLGL